MRVLALAMWGCVTPVEGDSVTTDAEDPLFTAVEVSLAPAAPTVPVVAWTTAEPVRSRVVFGEGLALSTPLEAEPATEHRQVLLGLPAGLDADVQIVTEDDRRSEVRTVRTGGVPASLPTLTVTGEGLDGGWMATSVLGDDGQGAGAVIAVIDGDGRYVWAHALGVGEASLRPRIASDGSGLYLNVLALDKEVEVPQSLRHVTWEGELVGEWPAADMHHDFVTLPGGGFAYLAVEPRQIDGFTLPSDTVVVVAPDGTSEVVWRLWDHLDRFGGAPALSEIGEGESLGHANAMQYVEEDDALLVNFALLGASALIARDGSEVRWVMGGDGTDFAYDAEGAMPLWRAHEVSLDGDALLMFVNDAGGRECSQLWEVALDFTAMTAARAWAYEPEDCTYNYVLGGVGRMLDGDVLATWSVAGRIDRVDRDEGVVWSAQASAGAGFGYGQFAPTLYRLAE